MFVRSLLFEIVLELVDYQFKPGVIYHRTVHAVHPILCSPSVLTSRIFFFVFWFKFITAAVRSCCSIFHLSSAFCNAENLQKKLHVQSTVERSK